MLASVCICLLRGAGGGSDVGDDLPQGYLGGTCRIFGTGICALILSRYRSRLVTMLRWSRMALGGGGGADDEIL